MENSLKPDLQLLLKKLNVLDLDPIKFKLMDSDEGEGWSREQADAVDVMYRRFLFLNVKYPEGTIVPTKMIDKFWHAHILDTVKYMEDCQDLFGEYLHHFPYLGMRDKQDALFLADSFTSTQILYLTEFGVELSQPASTLFAASKCSSACSNPVNCWSGNGCSGGKCNVKKEDQVRPTFEQATGAVELYPA